MGIRVRLELRPQRTSVARMLLRRVRRRARLRSGRECLMRLRRRGIRLARSSRSRRHVRLSRVRIRLRWVWVRIRRIGPVWVLVHGRLWGRVTWMALTRRFLRRRISILIVQRLPIGHVRRWHIVRVSIWRRWVRWRRMLRMFFYGPVGSWDCTRRVRFMSTDTDGPGSLPRLLLRRCGMSITVRPRSGLRFALRLTSLLLGGRRS